MTVAAFDLNDACLAVIRAGELLAGEIGYASLQNGELRFGREAWQLSRLRPLETQRRYWRDLTDAPFPRALGPCGSSANLVRLHLQRLWEMVARECDAVVLAVPAYWTEDQLGLLLGIAREAGVPVAGLVDSAVAACRRSFESDELWHLDATLHDSWLTRMDQTGGAAAVQRDSVAVGMEALYRGCAEFIARCFLATSRFDPLQDAGSEQQVYDALPDWLGRLARAEAAELELVYRGNVFRGRVRAADLRTAVAMVVEPLNQKLRTLLPPGGRTVLQLQHALAEIPGVTEALTRVPGVTLMALAPGDAARGALRVRPQAVAETHTLVKRLPFDQAAVPLPQEIHGSIPRGGRDLVAPTHLFFDGTVFRLGDQPLQIGQELSDHEFGIALGPRAQGVSRRHCTIQSGAGRVTLHDHSRYGTFLNGHRVEGSAVLQAGDRVSVGQPAVEFLLIVEVQGRGPTA